MNRETTNHRVSRRDARHFSEAVADKGQGAMAGGIDAELMDCARQGAHPIPIALLALPESSRALPHGVFRAGRGVQLACVNLLDQRGLGGDAEKHDWHVQALTQPGRGIEAALTRPGRWPSAQGRGGSEESPPTLVHRAPPGHRPRSPVASRAR
jgi:hypothetical protein